ncbi:MAG: YihY/virulence factor BrkB family protein [Thermodesulfobacteriota bacterium]|nr:YihY/virulence factor BrkB family protein [Thermodesulfobacteriota bacterium]
MDRDTLKYRTLLTVFRNATTNFINDECLTLASSIAYYFLLSIIPFVALIILIFNIIAKIVSVYYAEQISITALITEQIADFIPFISPAWVQQHLINPESVKSFTIMGIVLLPIISSFIFNILETSYRRIFKLPPRHLLISRTIYPLGIVTLIMLIFVTVFIANIAATAILHLIHLSPQLERIFVFFNNLPLPIGIHLISPVVFILFIMVTTAVFLNIRIRFKYQLFAGVFFYVLWLAAKVLFGLYITRISSLTLIYGSLSSIIIVLIWIYYAALVLLFTMEVMHELHMKDEEIEGRSR